MALETLKDVKEIGGFAVAHVCEDMGISIPAYLSDVSKPVVIDTDLNIIAFRIQNGPAKEVGVNGCQVDTLIHAARAIIVGLNKKFPCNENDLAIDRLTDAIEWLETRTKNRLARQVEGTNQL